MPELNPYSLLPQQLRLVLGHSMANQCNENKLVHQDIYLNQHYTHRDFQQAYKRELNSSGALPSLELLQVLGNREKSGRGILMHDHWYKRDHLLRVQTAASVEKPDTQLLPAQVNQHHNHRTPQIVFLIFLFLCQMIHYTSNSRLN